MKRLSKFFRDNFWVAFLIFLVAGIVFFAIEIAHGRGAEPPTTEDKAYQLLGKIGEALIVAAVLAFLVDKAAKSRLLEEFAMDISSHIIGRTLPAELRRPIEDYLKSDFVRSNWRLTYTITERQGGPGQQEYLQVVVRSAYEIQNRADTARHFKFRYRVEESSSAEMGETKITRFSANCLRNPGNSSFNYPIHSSPRPVSKNYNVTMEKTISIPPYPSSEYTFIGESIQYVNSGSILPFFTYYLVLSTTLTVEYPSANWEPILDLSFGDVEEDAHRTPLLNGVEWRFKKPMLPGQGFTIRLRRKSNVAAPPASGLSRFLHFFSRRYPHGIRRITP